MAELLPLTLDELLTTTRSVRKRLDLNRAVPREVVLECLEIAVQAPSGSNRQAWQFVVVDDAAKRKALADIYGEVFDQYMLAPASAGYQDGDTRAERRDAVSDSARYLRAHLHEVPVHLLAYQEGRTDGTKVSGQAGFWGSILPAVWSFMLAARARGLGTAWTTLHLMHEEAAAKILGIPYADITQCALIPVAHALGSSFKAGPRKPLDAILHIDTW